MSKRTPVILLRSLRMVRGGITRATITRANMLAKEFDKVIIVTFLFQQNHKEIIDELKREKILSKNVKVFNFFEDIKVSRKKNIRSENKQTYLVKEKGLIEIQDQRFKKEPSYRYYKNGLYLKYKRFTENGDLKFIDYMDAGRNRIKRNEYNEYGVLVRVRHMNQLLNKPSLDRYFNNRGECYLTVWINPKTGSEERTLLFSKKGIEYRSLYKAQEDWLNRILDDIINPVVMAEQRSSDQALRNVQHKSIKRISILHGSHLIDPFTDITKLKSGYDRLFNSAHKYDNIVFMTHEQKDDVETVYGEHIDFKVIPHPCEQIDAGSKEGQRVNYNSTVAVTLARFHDDKKLDEAINAFKFVVEEIPEAKYFIYGYGKLKDELELLINKLNLEKNVYLKKYTLNSKSVYMSAACSILTSKQEAFGMVLTESMAAGTPVISYDTKYGPKDIIDNGVNGFIVPKGDKKQLADKIISIMSDDNLRDRLSRNALQIKSKFSQEEYRRNWINLINK